jgi:exopolyphosphatase/pppGpp-phosphohydrolase
MYSIGGIGYYLLAGSTGPSSATSVGGKSCMSRPARLAVIEVGTKGVRLLVAERREPPQGMEVLRSQGELGYLGEGLEQNAGRMQPENIRRTLDHVRRFLDLARAHHPDQVVLVGTDVFRRAANGDDFRAGVPALVELRVLSPVEESVGSFLAASWGFRDDLPAGGRLVLIDLGGGSLEVVGGLQGDPPRPLAGISLRAMGTLALRGIWQRGPEPAGRDEDLRCFIDAEIGRHAAGFGPFRSPGGAGAGVLVAGLGSTVTDSAWALASGRLRCYSSDRVHGLRAAVPDLERLRREVLDGRLPEGTRGFHDALGHQLGLAALLAVLRALQAPAVTACGTGLRFGLAYAFLHDIPLALTAA